MGLLDLLKKLRKSDKEAKLLVLGLDNAGKTTLLKQLSKEDPEGTEPTQGFNVKTLVHDGFKLNVYGLTPSTPMLIVNDESELVWLWGDKEILLLADNEPHIY